MMIKTRPDLALYRRLVGQAWPYWREIATIFLLSLLSPPLALLTPLPAFWGSRSRVVFLALRLVGLAVGGPDLPEASARVLVPVNADY